MTKNRNLPRKLTWAILERDSFTCQYCGDSPGSSKLEIDHLIPYSLGGSDNEENLVCACVKCNRLKSNLISFPKSMCVGGCPIDPDWTVYKQFGGWGIKFSSHGVCLEYDRYAYPIMWNRSIHSEMWPNHIWRKKWSLPHTFDDFHNALDLLRLMVREEFSKDV